MIKIIFAFIVVIHGLIHSMGFLKEWKLASIDQLNGQTLIPLSGNLAKAAGIFWLAAGILFVGLTVPYLLKKDWWWMVALAAIIISQTMIIVYWQDARFGTIANIIVLLACIVGFGNWSFNRMVNQEITSFLQVPVSEKKILTDEMIGKLPPVVQKWLRHSGVVGKELAQIVYLEQNGEMRTTPSGAWMPFKAKQYFTVKEPGLIWTVDVKAAPLVHLAGRDKYINGHGHMLIKALSLFPVADGKGKEIDQGTLIRYMAESIWFPSSAISDYFTWEELDSNRARQTMTYGGITASGIYTFNDAGDIVSFEAKRYMDRKEGPTLETWFVKTDDNGYREFNGVRIPAISNVTWKLKDGDFTWAKMEITELKFNPDQAEREPLPNAQATKQLVKR